MLPSALGLWITLRYWFKARLFWVRVPVLTGPLQGSWMGLFCGSRFIRGRYDRSAVAVLSTRLRAGMVTYDVGAHVGYLSLLAARLVGTSGRVVAFEPLGLNLAYLHGHIRANRIDNIDVVPACVGDGPGFVTFDNAGGTGRGRMILTSRGTTPVVSIDDEIRRGAIRPPQFIKMDVEGAELAALHGARETLRQHRPVLLLSVHSDELRRHCIALLGASGYAIEATKKSNEVLAVPLSA